MLSIPARHLAFALPALCLLLALPAAKAAAPNGVWINPKESVAVQVENCAGRLCGRIVWLKTPRNGKGELKRDRHNPDPERRDTLLCGLRILGGFRPDGEGRWEGGWIYNPEDGKTYRSRLRLEGDDHLEVRGYVMLPLFGRSQTWRRVEEPLEGCGRPLPGALAG